MRIRRADPNDADLLVRIIDLASDGVLPAIWADLAPNGMSPAEVGRAMVLAEDGPFSHANGFVAEADGQGLGAMIGYRLPETPEPPDADVPPAFRPVQALESRVPRHWYVNMIAVLPEARNKGCGAALLGLAAKLARAGGCPGVALIVAASNEGAMRLYRDLGYEERARCPFDTSAYGHPPTEAVLMVRQI